ncbi:fumarylacetoacetate hydrolase family protein [Kaistia sp. 32K]|uniref:fumarylacetoacetate hydrolase family protein n=1 Tax=Kaistia sp. 32K TaxID=2795690 RepID=UPI0019154791|nr:fumarylacetoacetate hydrolase family protein [Kaistia sp. 32K]
MGTSQNFVVDAGERPSLPVHGSDGRYPVRRIYCIGRNYVAHVREMGGDEKLDFPIVFQKPTDSIEQDGAVLDYPVMTSNYHYELELVVAMKSGGYNIPVDKALDHVYGYGVGLDMTRRSVDGQSDRPNQPWELGKAFDRSCPVGTIYPVSEVGHVDKGSIRMTVDGEVKQDADLGMMIWTTPEIIANLSRYFALEAGDIILTGTPSGVGAVTTGQVLVGAIDGLGSLTVTISEPAGQ